MQTYKVNKYERYDIPSHLDDSEMDVQLRCLNWRVDVFVFMGLLPEALKAKWDRVNYILGVR